MTGRKGTKALELWCRRITEGYPDVSVQNMTTSWRDGLAFCAMIHRFRPDLIDFYSLNKDDIYGNNDLAFRTAEQLGIPALLDAEDMVSCTVPDRLSVLTYLSQFYQVFGSQPIKSEGSPQAIISKVPEPPKPEMSSRLGLRREVCFACARPVFLVERFVISGTVYHRGCFRCARCRDQLTPSGYYETEAGQYCCNVCPDEENNKRPTSERNMSETTDNSDGGDDMITGFLRLMEAPLSDEEKTKRRSLDMLERSAVALESADAPNSKKLDFRDNFLDRTEETHRNFEEKLLKDGDVIVDSDNKTPVPEIDEIDTGDNNDSNENPNDINSESREIEGNFLVITAKSEETVLTDVSIVENTKDSKEPNPLEISPFSYPRSLEVHVIPAFSTPEAEDKKKTAKNYPEDLNPFGDEEEEAEQDEAPGNPFDDDEDEEESSPRVQAIKKSPKSSTNPFWSDGEDPEDDQVTIGKPNSLIPESGLCKKNSSLVSSSNSINSSSSHKKKKPAPPPPAKKSTPEIYKPKPSPPSALKQRASLPVSKNLFSDNDHQVWAGEKLSKDEANRNTQSLSPKNKSAEGKWKRKKGPAPARPIPFKRKIKVMSLKDVKLEFDHIELQQQGLERQGVRLEKIIRDKCECGEAVGDSSLNPDIEELILELFAVVNEKNELFRRQAELMLLRRQQRLEEEHADLEYQIRCLIIQPETTKTDCDKQKEEILIQRLVDIVERRNEIVECFEMDRRREEEEDRSIHREMDLYAARSKTDSLDQTDESQQPSNLKKKTKEKSHEKKAKKNGKKDADKDFDETEVKVKVKRKWF